MAVSIEVALSRFEDGVLTTTLAPPANISGWEIRYLVTKRVGGGSGVVERWAASGYGGGESGITITDSGQGVFTTDLRSVDFSGQDFGAYAVSIDRMDSGSRTKLAGGWYLNTP